MYGYADWYTKNCDEDCQAENEAATGTEATGGTDNGGDGRRLRSRMLAASSTPGIWTDIQDFCYSCNEYCDEENEFQQQLEILEEVCKDSARQVLE